MRVAAWIWIVFWTAGAAVSALAFYDGYWRFRDCFDEHGRCFDPAKSVVHHAQSGVAWLTMAVVCALLALAGLALLFARRDRKDAASRPLDG